MDIRNQTRKAVSTYWQTRELQKKKQEQSGATDKGSRSAVTGGAQMDGFIDLCSELIRACSVPEACIFHKKSLELPGYYRPTKEWDILVVENDRLLVAIETKSQVGPSFGNNFNNRVEESIGSAVDLWRAYQEGVFGIGIQPFIGYLFMLEDCESSNRPVSVKEPHFPVLGEFRDTSYKDRYELFCRKLVLERHYTSVCYLTSRKETGLTGDYWEPVPELSVQAFSHVLKTTLQASRKNR